MTGVISITPQIDYISKLVQKGGPAPSEWSNYQQWLDKTISSIKKHRYKISDIYLFYEAYGDALSIDTMQGFCLRKPHGYVGDFEIIERIYSQRVSNNPLLKNWDLFFHSQPAAKAVRNRKAYFKKLLEEKTNATKGKLRILNIASGSSRDLFEFLEENPDVDVEIQCIDLDENAIAFSKKLLKNNLHRVSYQQQNIFRFTTEKKFDLIWSAGLFDYFNDNIFTKILSHFQKWLAPNGEIVVGNFSPRNPSQHYMDLVDWILNYRTESALVELAKASGVTEKKNIYVEQEPEGINLFLRIL